MQNRKTQTGKLQRRRAGDGCDGRRPSTNSLESLYSLHSGQSSSSKHLKTDGRMHSSHHYLMNYATLSCTVLLCHSPLAGQMYLPQPLTKLKPNPELSLDLLYFGKVDDSAVKITTVSLDSLITFCFAFFVVAVAQVESQVGQTTSVTETVWGWMMNCSSEGTHSNSAAAEPESTQALCRARTILSPSHSR